MYKIFTLPNCARCNLTKKKMDKEDMPWEAVDLTQDEDAMAWVREQGYHEAPVVLAPNGEHWGGYNVTKLNEHAALMAV